MGYEYELQGRVKFSEGKISLPSEVVGVPFYRRVVMEEAKTSC
jgi:hypothetical protein